MQTLITIATDTMAKNKSYKSIMMGLIPQLKSGDVFLTEVPQTSVTAYAKAHDTKVKTEQCVLIEDYKTDNPKLIKVTKVTII